MSKFVYILLIFLALGQWTSAQKAGDLKTILLPGNVPMEFVYIPAGTFFMGSPEQEHGRQNDESPRREISITKGFYMGKFEVTQEQWLIVMKRNPSVFSDKNSFKSHPVDWVSWNDCNEFIQHLNGMGLGTFRMPTEAEWEYACRAGTKTRYYWGNDPNNEKVYQFCWAFSRAEGRSHPVGLKKPNPWGLYDMSGNVWEWCSDWRGPYNPSNTTNPKGAETGTKKIYRGGSWFNKPATLRSANRNGHEPDIPFTNAGLRIVLEVKP
jgi:formylglycine-generating enzyme required for sulfatase activity